MILLTICKLNVLTPGITSKRLPIRSVLSSNEKMSTLAKSESTFQLVRRWIRFRLRERGWTYADLAKKLHVSEVSVKRWMSSSDLSMSKFFKVCKVLDIEPHFLLGHSAAIKGVGVEYSLEQETYLADHPEDFYLFIRLLKNRNANEVQTEIGMTKANLQRALGRLEAHHLIQRKSEESVVIKTMGPYRFRDDGPLTEKIFQSFKNTIFKHFQGFRSSIEPQSKKSSLIFRPFELYLDPAMADEMSAELMKVLYRYRSLSMQGFYKAKNGKSYRPYGGVLCFDQVDFWKETLQKKS